MRYKRVMLVNPKYKGHYPAFLPTGLGYVAEALLDSGIECDCVDLGLKSSVWNLSRRIASFSPDLLGIQMMTYHYFYTYKLIKQIKAMFPHLNIVVGGPHASTFREKLLEENECVDYGVTLEGEFTIIDLCRGELPMAEIRGLLFRQDGKVTYTGDREFIDNLDAVSFPCYENFDLSAYPSRTIPIVSSRGCPYSCTFCPVKLTIGKKLRVRSARSVVNEIEYWWQRGYRKFGFTDDNFTFYKDRVYDICDEIDKRDLKNLEFVLGNGVRADKVDRKLLARMRQVGFTWIAIGVEAGNDRVLERIQKAEKIESIERAIKDACELGFDVNLFFLIGSPGETEADVQDSLSLALKYPIANVNFYNLIPFPGTELFTWIEKNGYFVHSPEEYLNKASHWINEPAFETPELPAGKRKNLWELGRKVSNKVRMDYMKRKLQKYGPLADIAGAIYASNFVQRVILPNTAAKKAVRKLYSMFVN